MTRCNVRDIPAEKWQGFLDSLRFDDRGLLPAVVQDDRTREVLMVAWVNREALEETILTGRTVFFSRSRSRLWRKGETSGNYQIVKAILYDCDMDTLLLKVDPCGPACHTGHRSCFYRTLGAEEEAGFSSPEDPGSWEGVLSEVYDVLVERKRLLPSGSYTASLFVGGQDRILKKVTEEAGEVLLGSKNQDSAEIIREMADLWFHCLLVLAWHDLRPELILEELRRRRGPEHPAQSCPD